MLRPFEAGRVAVACAVLVAIHPVQAQSPKSLTPHRVRIDEVDYLGKHGVRIVEDSVVPNGQAYAIVKDSTFHNGRIEVELAGRPVPGAFAAARGYVGIVFRLKDEKFEYIYLRPTNGRADDQVRRNHTTQYSSYPSFDYATARKEAPEKYESYVDVEAGAWTRVAITVEGSRARLFVNGATQPSLIVNDLKLGDATGGVGLWIGPGTEGFFRGLSIVTSGSVSGLAVSLVPRTGLARHIPRDEANRRIVFLHALTIGVGDALPRLLTE